MFQPLSFLVLILVSASAAASIHSGGRNYQGQKDFQGWLSQYPRPALSQTCQNYCQSISIASQKYGLPEGLITSVIHHESGFNPLAVSPKGAKGLMQLMDINSRAANINPFEPDANIDAGTALLARLMNKYGRLDLALAAYNAGEGNVDKYQGIPPFPETQNYVANVMKHYQRGHQ